MNYDSFANEWLGKRVADPQLGAVGLPPEQFYQCVSLIKQYLRECFGIEAGFWGDAIAYWSATNPNLYAKFDRIETAEVVKGDIVVLKTRGRTDYGGEGHIMIGTGGLNASQFEGLEQNGQTGGGTGIGGDAIRTRWVNKDRVAGVLRPKALAPEIPYTITDVDPYKVDVLAGHQKWDLSHPDFASVAANPILTLNQQTTITVAAELHHKHIADYTYLLEDPNVPQGYNKLDTVPYVPPAPVYVPPAAPLTVPKAPKYQLVTEVKYYGSPADAQNRNNSLGTLPVNSYYQISTDKEMLNLSSNNMKDLQHWVNPKDNVAPMPEPVVMPAEETQPKTDDSWKQITSFNPNRKPVRYVLLQDYTVVDQAGIGANRKIARYTEMSIYGTFVKNGITYGLIHLAVDSGWSSYYGLPMFNADGTNAGIVEAEQELYSPETDVMTRQATKALTIHDYEILLLDKVERAFKNIDGILPRRKKK